MGNLRRARADSNGRPLAPEASALSTELRAQGPEFTGTARRSLHRGSRRRYGSGHGPFAVLRRDRWLGAKRTPRTARVADTQGRRSAAVRLRRRHSAPTRALGGPGRHGERVHHALPCRPLAWSAGDAEVLRPARAPRSAHRLWATRAERADGGDAHRLRATAVPARCGGARAGADRRARRLPDRLD